MNATVIVDIAGWLGAGSLLLAYALLSMGRLRPRVVYQLLNLAGAVGLAVNTAYHQAWPSAAVNVVWLAIGVTAIVRLTRPDSANRSRPADQRDGPHGGEQTEHAP